MREFSQKKLSYAPPLPPKSMEAGNIFKKDIYLQLEHNLHRKSRLQSAVIHSLIGSFKNGYHYQLRTLEFLTDSSRQNSLRGGVGDLHLQLCPLTAAFSFAVGHWQDSICQCLNKAWKDRRKIFLQLS